MSEDQRDAGMPETPEEADAALLTHGCMLWELLRGPRGGG
jgi:hypothetical protein